MVDRIIELGLFKRRKTDIDKAVTRLGKLYDRFLALFSEIATDGESRMTGEFRSRLNEHRAEISRAVDAASLEASIPACLALCQDYLRGRQEYLLEREAELAQVIEVLRKAVLDLAGDSSSFTDRLMDTSARFTRLMGVEDIKGLRQMLVDEVAQLERVIVEKQRRERATLTQITGRIEDLEARLNQAKREASMDPLLGVANRGSFDRCLQAWVRMGESRPFVLAILDVDNFKKINDSHGHLIGDQVLLCVCKWLLKNVRSEDFLARYGGDEFAVLLRDLTLPEAQERFRMILEQISGTDFEYGHSGVKAVHMTTSCGLAAYISGDTAESLIQRADQAMYDAKKRGKTGL